jgi:hypothetical protein
MAKIKQYTPIIKTSPKTFQHITIALKYFWVISTYHYGLQVKQITANGQIA